MNAVSFDHSSATSLLDSLIKSNSDDVLNVERVLDAGADMDARSEGYGKTSTFKAAELNKPKILELFIRRVANLETASSTYNNTPLHAAARKGNRACAALLLQAGANVFAQTKLGNSALHLAIEGGFNEVAEDLVLACAPLEARNHRGRTPLHVAASKGNAVGAALLLKRGADVNAQTVKGKTPLHKGAKKGDETIVQLLLDAHADKKAKTFQSDETPHDIALKVGNRAVADLLKV